MSDEQDIVERLRDYAESRRFSVVPTVRADCDEAASRIERLRREVEELRSRGDHLDQHLSAFIAGDGNTDNATRAQTAFRQSLAKEARHD